MLKHHSIRRILPLTAAILLGLLAWRVGAQIATGGPILPPFSLAVPDSKPLPPPATYPAFTHLPAVPMG
ncbi:MAG: hypothetical protein WCI73_19445, partial [Phycisphaerae bacterium]